MNHSKRMNVLRAWGLVVLGTILVVGGCARRPMPIQVLKPGNAS